MTSAVGEPRRDNPALMFIGHYAFLSAFAWAALCIAEAATGGNVPAVVYATMVTWFVWMSTNLIVGDVYHAHRLCERCIAATPLDPQASVVRWNRALWLKHNRRWQCGTMVGLLAAAVLFQEFHYGWAGWIFLTLTTLAVVVFEMADLIHRRLYPWCPFCRWGGGGYHEFVPGPDPAMSKS